MLADFDSFGPSPARAVAATPDEDAALEREVRDRMIVERYSHVMHIVSGVEGKLSAGKTPYDLTCRDGREHGGCARRFRRAR